MIKKPPLTSNPTAVEFDRATEDRAAVLARYGRAMKWENPIRTEARRKQLARIEAIITECTAFDKLPAYTSRVPIDWPIVFRSGFKLRPITRPQQNKR